jgi:hypothetical protein
MIDESLLAKYFSQPVADELKKYAKNNKLKFKRKADFMRILEYYDEIRSKDN